MDTPTVADVYVMSTRGSERLSDATICHNGGNSPVGHVNAYEVAGQGISKAVNEVLSEVKSCEVKVPSKSSKKPYMDYRTVTDVSSKQWELLHRKEVWTDVNGLLRFNNSYVVACGSKFGNIGDMFMVFLQDSQGTKKTITVVMGDQKQDRHTLDSQGWVGVNGHIFEMIVDVDRLDPTAKFTGDCNYIPGLNGEIIKIMEVKNGRYEII